MARALAEDIGDGDVSARLAVQRLSAARLLSKDHGVIAGSPWFEACFRALDPNVQFDWSVSEGQSIRPGQDLCRIAGQSQALLSAERSALNFLQLLSGTASRTADYVAAVAGTGVRILDTRKTIPGLRHAQKYAVRVGGGQNHRMGLFDAVMIKENHIQALGSIADAVRRARAAYPSLPLIVEVESLDELTQALEAGPDRILIDDFSHAQMRAAVAMSAGRVLLEVSGGVDLDTVRAVAETGVHCISVGALTKHLRATDFSLRFEVA
ncbi:MAG: nicotinate-nucleotide diphosphorylase (carboxylating) [Gammaproteobacteria bacterium HGW-Gammaproteobacteria-7]|nr:MAG: nicotinate-nucleotide diphosphorylase (carboxylating) [Gammaproteobacteria bacterium HGW-Gammaproteobacteria-7]